MRTSIAVISGLLLASWAALQESQAGSGAGEIRSDDQYTAVALDATHVYGSPPNRAFIASATRRYPEDVRVRVKVAVGYRVMALEDLSETNLLEAPVIRPHLAEGTVVRPVSYVLQVTKHTSNGWVSSGRASGLAYREAAGREVFTKESGKGDFRSEKGDELRLSARVEVVPKEGLTWADCESFDDVQITLELVPHRE